MIAVLFVTLWAMMINLVDFWTERDFLLSGLSVIIMGLTVWLLAGGIMALSRKIASP